MLLKKNAFLLGNSPGFGFIEIIIAIALVGILVGVSLPNVLGRRDAQERKAFVTQINSIMSEVWLSALQTNKIHKVNFDLKNRKIDVSKQTDAFDVERNPVFEHLILYFSSNSYRWPEAFDIQQFYAQKVDRIAEGGLSRNAEDVWFFVMPGGTSQEVIINIVDQSQNQSEKEGKQFGIVLNPFIAQCVMYDSFQKPAL